MAGGHSNIKDLIQNGQTIGKNLSQSICLSKNCFISLLFDSFSITQFFKGII